MFLCESVKRRSAPCVKDINAEPVAVDGTRAHTESTSGVRNEQNNGERVEESEEWSKLLKASGWEDPRCCP